MTYAHCRTSQTLYVDDKISSEAYTETFTVKKWERYPFMHRQKRKTEMYATMQ